MIGALVNEAFTDVLGLLQELPLRVFLNVFAEYLDLVMSKVFKALVRPQVLSQCDAFSIAPGTKRVRTLLVKSQHILYTIHTIQMINYSS